MGTGAEERFDRITRMAKQLFGVPIAEINFIDQDHQFTKSPQAPGGPSFGPRADSFCDVVVQQPDIIVVPDALEDARFAHRGSVTGAPHIRFYAGRPLSVSDGAQVGTICLVDTAARDLTEEDQDLLDELGAWVERELRHLHAGDLARHTQQQLLPAPLVHDDGFTVAGFTQPHSEVAGDYFASLSSPGEIEVTLADVMGKGYAAAIIAATVRSAFQARPGWEPAAAVTAVNEQLLADLSATGTFATLFHAGLDTRTGVLRYADAGHGLSVIIRADGTLERLTSTGLPIGIGEGNAWEAHETALAPGEILFSCSDGALDLYDGTLSALDELGVLVRRSADDASLFAALSDVIGAVRPEDDVTMLVIRRHEKETRHL
jgi:sigma-B regulation protein RsbU (phosphoserine phosphatase)